MTAGVLPSAVGFSLLSQAAAEPSSSSRIVPLASRMPSTLTVRSVAVAGVPVAAKQAISIAAAVHQSARLSDGFESLGERTAKKKAENSGLHIEVTPQYLATEPRPMGC